MGWFWRALTAGKLPEGFSHSIFSGCQSAFFPIEIFLRKPEFVLQGNQIYLVAVQCRAQQIGAALTLVELPTKR
jgi:hypothetical protein